MSNPSYPHKAHLVFLPGWGFKSTIFTSIAETLSDYAVTLYDLPCIEQSDSSHTLASLARKMNAELPESCILIAWSLGGLLATTLCHDYPQKYKKLILIASTPQFKQTPAWAGMEKENAQQFCLKANKHLPMLLSQFHSWVLSPHQQASALTQLQQHAYTAEDKISLLFYLNLLMQTDNREAYTALTQPTLQFFGGQDAILNREAGQQLFNYYPTHFLEQAGHIPFLTHPSWFLEKVVTFINE